MYFLSLPHGLGWFGAVRGVVDALKILGSNEKYPIRLTKPTGGVSFS